MDPTDWQGNKGLVNACRYMLDCQIATDVTFIVGQQQTTLKAHKFMLICRSSVFQAMFSSNFADNVNAITITDIEPEVFQSLLKYMYTDEVDLNGENILPVLYTAKKYAVNNLVHKCLTFLNNGRTCDNICLIFEQAHLYDEKDLRNNSLIYILENAKEVFGSSSFLQLCPACVQQIIAHDDLHADEKLVCNAVIKWAECQCKKQNIGNTGENIRLVLGGNLFLIRFPLLGQSYFTDVLSEVDYLTDSEKVELFKYFYKSGSDCRKFNCKPRFYVNTANNCEIFNNSNGNDCQLQTCMRFSRVNEEDFWSCGELDALDFIVSENIFLHGILLYGCYIGENTYDIACYLYDFQDKCVAQLKKEIKTNEHLFSYMILFDKQVKIIKGKKYCVAVEMSNVDGVDTYRGCEGQSNVNVGNVKFTFYKSKRSHNGTEVRQGQIPGLLFSYNE